MFEPHIKTVYRWYLTIDGERIRCRTKGNALHLGRAAYAAGKAVSLTEEYDLFDRAAHIDHQEFDRTVLLTVTP